MSFERFVRRAIPVLEEKFGAEVTERLIADARVEHDEIVPRLPDIGGGANVFAPVITVNGWMVALHRAMLRHGYSAEETIAVCFEVTDRLLRSMPRWLLALVGRLAFSSPARRYFERQAERSQKREYSEDFVWKLEQREDGQLSFVFSECAVNKFYDREGLTELKPYCNFVDVTYSRLMNMGVDAHETIGQGCSQCALRFKHGRATEVPPLLTEIIEGH